MNPRTSQEYLRYFYHRITICCVSYFQLREEILAILDKQVNVAYTNHIQ